MSISDWDVWRQSLRYKSPLSNFILVLVECIVDCPLLPSPCWVDWTNPKIRGFGRTLGLGLRSRDGSRWTNSRQRSCRNSSPTRITFRLLWKVTEDQRTRVFDPCTSTHSFVQMFPRQLITSIFSKEKGWLIILNQTLVRTKYLPYNFGLS